MKIKEWIKLLVLNSFKKSISSPKDLIFTLVLVLLTLQLGKGIYSQRMKSPCYDEPLHIQVGLDYWKKYDHGYGFTNPTLPERIIALPQILFASDTTTPQLWLGRIPVFLTMLMLGVVLFVWVRARTGNNGH